MRTFRIFLMGAILASTTPTALARVVKLYGGDKLNRGISVRQSQDGGFIIAGYSSFIGHGEEDVLLLKTDRAGDVQWMKTYGGAQSDNGWAVIPTDDKGYIVTGFTKSLGAGGYDVYVVKTDADGNALWEKTFGGSADDRSWDFDRAQGGGFIIVGETASAGSGERDALLLKIDDRGNLLWQKTYGGSKDDRCFSVQSTEDGGAVFAGITYSYGAGDRDAYIVRTDAEGNERWHKTFGGEKADVAHAVRRTSDGGFIVTGYNASFAEAQNDVYLIKLNADGEVEWSRTFGGEDDYHTLYGEETPDGGFILSGGIVLAEPGNMVGCLIKTDPQGALLWQRTFTGFELKKYNVVRGYNGGRTSDGGYIFTGDAYNHGSQKSEVFFVKVDKDGN